MIGIDMIRNKRIGSVILEKSNVKSLWTTTYTTPRDVNTSYDLRVSVLYHFQQYFNYMVAVSFTDGGNQIVLGN